MNYREKLPVWLAKTGLVMFAFVAASCGDDNPSNPPTTGSIEVSASTTGDELDADGYTVTVDGGAGQALAINGSVTFTNQAAGNREVELSGLAANCTVTGDNPRVVAVTAGSTATTTFEVACSATAGELEVTTASTGDNIDADGYTVSVDGGAAQAIDVNGTLTVADLDAGDHTVELGDVAANCSVAGDNPRTVAVTAGGTATTQFDVACTALLGDLDVVTSTTGNGLPAGYNFTVDGGAPQAIDADATVTLVDLPVGDHDVELADIPANCSVTGDNPVTVAVSDGATAQAAFDVTCTQGTMDITTNTWGLDLDVGYSVVVDGDSPGQDIGNNAQISVPLSVGDHTVELRSIRANCTVQNGTNPRTETVSDGAVTPTQFDVFCWETLDMDAMFQTDRDGNPELYVRIEGGPVFNMTNNPAQDRNPSVASDGSSVVFDSDRSGASQIWKMDVNGFTQLTTGGSAADPDFGGDPGSERVAFHAGGQIFVMDADGANRTAVSSSPTGDDRQAAFSPDGNWILFSSQRDGNSEVYVVNVGTGVETRLTNDAGVDTKPAWWFDGSRVLWVSDRTGDFEIYVADFDSVTPAIGVETNLTNDPTQGDFVPDMRPTGAAIAFVRDGTGLLDIWTMQPDGSGKSPLFGATPSNDTNPSWSPTQ